MQMILVAGGWVHHSLPKKKKKRAHCHAQTFLLCASFTFSPASVFFPRVASLPNAAIRSPSTVTTDLKKFADSSNARLLCVRVSVCLSVCPSFRAFDFTFVYVLFVFFLFFLWKCFGKILFVNRGVIRGRFVGI